jgi:hypothetical protein
MAVPLSSTQDQLRHAAELEEYKTLRHKIELTINNMTTNERWVVLGIGSLWTWLSTHGPTLGSARARFAWWIPVFFAIAGALKAWALRRHLGLLCRYLREELEDRLCLRWEGWYEKQPGWTVRQVTTWAWAALVGLTILVALLMMFRAPSSVPNEKQPVHSSSE